MSRFSLHPALSSLKNEQGTLKPIVRLVGGLMVMGLVGSVLLVVAMKGRSSHTSEPEKPPVIGVSQTAPLDALMATKPTDNVIAVKSPPPDESESQKKAALPSPEIVAMQKQAAETQAMRQAMLAQAVYSGMTVRFDGASIEPSTTHQASSSTNAQITQAHQRWMDSNPSQASVMPQQATSSEVLSLDTTMGSQASKEAFLAQANNVGYLNATRTLAKSEHELTVGTVIPATLISAINSDTPNNLVAQVSQNVYDSATGGAILIPQGTQLYGTYDSRVAYGQRRLPVTWSRVNFPDGTKLDLGGMSSMDTTGQGGLTGKVNNHFWKLFGQAT
ncbi:TrbI/VirB10 family protein, partial [uncultured Vibrio sp.]|uniref:TrbI/VirB10 family protein n=2 Tax=uncultured Vibrio sp. TaxID=114054 RepID=UPI00261BEA6D